ncbi:Flp pilus assembly protein CpaB [Rossellomorea aquimaris]|uniref:Flp pilus assembly protein CpaB n=1 Tax=Rossellomorea aquimaris TaxID=189382 RepID=UPI0037CC8F42
MIDSKRKAIIFLTLSFILAVVAAGVILVQISQAQERLGETVKVAAAAGEIKSYHEIKSSDIKWIELPKNSAYQSFITDEEELKNVISLVDIKEDDILTGTLIRDKVNIPADERVVWLNATEIVLIDQGVVEGDQVDIIVSREIDKKLETKRLLSNVPVVQIETSDEKPEEGPAQRVKISLSVEEAEKLIHYQNFAKQIRVLRVNQVADDKETTQGVSTEEKKETEVKKEEKPKEEQKETQAKDTKKEDSKKTTPAAEQKKQNNGQ